MNLTPRCCRWSAVRFSITISIVTLLPWAPGQQLTAPQSLTEGYTVWAACERQQSMSVSDQKTKNHKIKTDETKGETREIERDRRRDRNEFQIRGDTRAQGHTSVSSEVPSSEAIDLKPAASSQSSRDSICAQLTSSSCDWDLHNLQPCELVPVR